MRKWYYKDLFFGTARFQQNMGIKNLLLLSLFLIGFSYSTGQINCDSEWVKKKGIKSVLIEPKILNPGDYIEYFEYSTSGNLTYHEKYDDDDKYVMIFNDDELLIWDISFTRTDKQSTKWDTSKVYQYSYDSSNNIKTYRYINYDQFKGEKYISYSSYTSYDHSDSLITITTEDYSEYKSSNEILVEKKTLNRLGKDSIIVGMTRREDTTLDTFSITTITYDNLARPEKIELISSLQIGVTELLYYGKSSSIKMTITSTTNLHDSSKEKITRWYYRSNDLKERLTVHSKNGTEKLQYDRTRYSCGLRYHLKEVRSSNAKVTIEYY